MGFINVEEGTRKLHVERNKQQFDCTLEDVKPEFNFPMRKLLERHCTVESAPTSAALNNQRPKLSHARTYTREEIADHLKPLDNSSEADAMVRASAPISQRELQEFERKTAPEINSPTLNKLVQARRILKERLMTSPATVHLQLKQGTFVKNSLQSLPETSKPTTRYSKF